MSPTYEVPSRFQREFVHLPREQRRAFRTAVAKLVTALKHGSDPPRSLRIKRVQGTRDIWELTYSGDGRATYRYGPEQKLGDPHVVWLRIGGHDILSRPE